MKNLVLGQVQSKPGSSTSVTPSAHSKSGESIEQCVLRSLEQYFADLDGARPHALYELVSQAVERPLLQFAMRMADGNQSAAAELLGINRNTLRKKLQQHSMLQTD